MKIKDLLPDMALSWNLVTKTKNIEPISWQDGDYVLFYEDDSEVACVTLKIVDPWSWSRLQI